MVLGRAGGGKRDVGVAFDRTGTLGTKKNGKRDEGGGVVSKCIGRQGRRPKKDTVH